MSVLSSTNTGLAAIPITKQYIETVANKSFYKFSEEDKDAIELCVLPYKLENEHVQIYQYHYSGVYLVHNLSYDKYGVSVGVGIKMKSEWFLTNNPNTTLGVDTVGNLYDKIDTLLKA